MKKYNSYKNSGIEWIGEIPSHWKLNKVGNNTYVKGRIGWKGLRSEDFIDEGPYLITGTDFYNDGSINWDKMYHVCQERYDEDPFIQLKDHDVLITKDGTIGKVVYVGKLKGQTCLNSGIFLTRPLINEYIPKFFYWVLNSNVFKVFVDYNSGGSTIQHLYQNVFVNFKIPLPPIPEQTQIVNYLETKTNLIDTLIQKTQEKINLLREKRTSLINHVVTIGLNPLVEMKDSGIEWIGKIPKHWEIVTLKYLVESKITDGPHETPEFVDEGIPFLSVESVQDGKLDFNKKRGFITRELHEIYSKKCKPQRDDIFIVKSGSTTGKSTIVETDEEFNIWSPLCIIRPIKEKITPRFTFLSVQSDYFRRYIELGWSFGTQPNIGMGVIENLRLLVPPLFEQVQIIEYIEEQTLLIDTLVQKEEIRVGLLKEFRQSFISDLVTGKIKVTDHE